MEPKTILQKYWGYSSFREGQREIIDSILSKRDTVAILPTGGGKSLCFQVPALSLPGLTIVISPLISLMQDQVQALQKRNIAATFINSSLSTEEQNQRLKAAQNNELKLLYLSPERLATIPLESLTLSLLVIDEAHCISIWGNDFRPSYTKIISYFTKNRPPILAVTATATTRILKDITGHLTLQDPAVFTQAAVRKNLSLQIMNTPTQVIKLLFVFEILKIHSNQDGIIYAATRKQCEYVALVLSRLFPDRSVSFYHGGLAPEERKSVQDAFIAGSCNIVVATNAFGMGVDKPDVRFVVHFDTPISVEDYSQEIGRAGRDQKQSWCYTFYSEKDLSNRLSFVTKNASAQKKAYTERNAQIMQSILLTKNCKTQQLAHYFTTKTHHCYNCSSCIPKQKLQKRLDRAINSDVLRSLQAISSKLHTPLPPVSARILSVIQPHQLQYIPGLGIGFQKKQREIALSISSDSDKIQA
ncbi:MAG: ATP-dependent DNA helicase RecQ [Pseudomonadales bacterium]|nr:ATP-dependent DNA helicase RecQ [Candidatus Woesebacteria bacterium]MCB9800648.1 ATP-dependent DNA helicase RecQ [Pseudomonadales bacterium]